jgi:SNF2 family DNA or RNA helicase
MSDFKFKTKPYAHQVQAFELMKDRKSFALIADMGTGKSKMLLDNAVYLYNKGEIDALLVLAPSGVHQNWVINEIPTHLALPNHMQASAAWNSSMRKEDKESLAAVVDLKLGLRIVCMNVEALITKKGLSFVQKYLSMFRTMMVLDESQKFKTPQAKRTKAVLKLSKHAPYKRISTGTPITNSPLDAYSQFAFLDPYILGFQSFVAFRAHFAILERKINHTQQRQYTQVIGFQNLDELQALIKPHSYRVTKEECLDLPDKIYEKVYFELSAEQKRLYKAIKEEVMLEFSEGRVTAQLAITKLLRLSQIISGFMTTEDGDIIAIKGGDVKLKLLKDVLEDNQEKTIIWCRFIYEINRITEMLGDACVSYYGATESDDRAKNVFAFQNNPDIKYFVANKTASTGLTLTSASSVIYYSNSYSLEDRLQSEDRAMRIGQKNNVVYRDLVARNTVDEKIIKALRNKQNIADIILKDIAGFIS